MSKFIVYTDGGSRGNPGPAAIGVYIGETENSDFAFRYGQTIGQATNNIAEYTAVLEALGKIRFLLIEHAQVESLEFRLDSLLVVSQINGKYKIKEPTLQLLHQKVKQMLAEIDLPYLFVHVPRAQNAEADALVNQAFDGQL
jgi:ribonuclease HI